MIVREIQAKTLLTSYKHPDPWFGIKYTMNLYRGCEHACIYCDSRSECYGIEDFDGEVLVKANALELLRKELPRKRVKGYVGTGSMNDPYMPLERERRLTRGALEIVAANAFPVHILTKSDLVLRDLDVIQDIERTAGSGAAVVSFTITTPDDKLSRQIEPGAPPSSRRFAALKSLADAGIRTGVMLMPVLPFIEDTEDSITGIVEHAAQLGARHVVAAFGMTLRDRQRRHYYAQLDRLFPGIRQRYERAFGERYSAESPAGRRLERVYEDVIARRGLARVVAPWVINEPVPPGQQLRLF
jgi:DNA repair photolyase